MKTTRVIITGSIIILTTLFILTGSAFDQCEAQYVPLQTALDAMNSDAQVSVTTRTVAGWADAPNYYYEFTPAGGSPTEALIIYPGANLDERANAVQAPTIAASGYLVAIVPMPSYLAIYGIDRADAVISNHPEIIKWSIGGHSFGGVGACWYLTGGYTYSHKINGIVLWASYPDAAQPSKNPEVLLCDEPTGALDSDTGVVVLEALEQVNRELGTGTVIITHNADIAYMADRVIHLSNGQIAEIKKNPTKKMPRELHW